MKITGNAETSARLGVAAYTVAEEDRKVTWTLMVGDLESMADWDRLTREERRDRQAAVASQPTLRRNPDPAELEEHERAHAAFMATLTDPIDKVAASYYDCDWLDLHAIVARNALRNFLGIGEDAKPARRSVVGLEGL